MRLVALYSLGCLIGGYVFSIGLQKAAAACFDVCPTDDRESALGIVSFTMLFGVVLALVSVIMALTSHPKLNLITCFFLIILPCLLILSFVGLLVTESGAWPFPRTYSKMDPWVIALAIWLGSIILLPLSVLLGYPWLFPPSDSSSASHHILD